jgi:hypothetical protein
MEARISMALYQEKLLRESSSNPIIELQSTKVSVPSPAADKVKSEEAKVVVKPKKSSEDKENRSDHFNTPSKLETLIKPKPITMKTSPMIVENFAKDVPLKLPKPIFEEVKDAPVLPHAV